MNYYNQYNFNQQNSQPSAPDQGSSADALYTERRRLRRAGNAIGGGLLIFSALPVLIGVVIGLLPFAGEWGEKALDLLSSEAGIWVLQNFLSCLVFTLPFILAAAFYGQAAHKVVMLAAPEKGSTLPLVLMGMGTCGVANWLTAMLENLIGYQPSGIEEMMGGLPEGPYGMALVFLTICAVAPLVEEFAFRGVVLGLLRNVSEPFAIFASALLFGLMHGTLSQIPYAFILGLVLGFIAVKAGSIWPACLVHLLANLFSVIMIYAAGVLSEESLYALSSAVYTATFCMGLLGVILFVKKFPKGFNIAKEQPTLSGGAKFAAFAGTPCMIIFLIVILLEILVNESNILEAVALAEEMGL